MALAQAAMLFWMQALATWSTLGAGAGGRDCKDEWGRSTPRLTTGEAIERAGAMVDRFNKIFLRTLRTLSDLRRHPPTVIVQNANQVIVSTQQVNMAHGQ
jgi:hypothetical protein